MYLNESFRRFQLLLLIIFFSSIFCFVVKISHWTNWLRVKLCHTYLTFLFSLISASWKQKFEEKKDFFLNYNNMKINQKLYPQPVLKCMVSTLKIPLNSADLFDQASNCNDEDLSGLQGSFRKLEID